MSSSLTVEGRETARGTYCELQREKERRREIRGMPRWNWVYGYSVVAPIAYAQLALPPLLAVQTRPTRRLRGKRLTSHTRVKCMHAQWPQSDRTILLYFIQLLLRTHCGFGRGIFEKAVQKEQERTRVEGGRKEGRKEGRQ